MKVKRMISNSVGALAQTMKVIVILDLEIISPGSQVGAKIGNPQQLEADGKVTVVTGNSLNNPCAGDGFRRPAAQEDLTKANDPDQSNFKELNVKMARSLSKLEESLECPVCYKIPRDLPIPCCVAGHIVCQPCRSKVTNCPTCRGRLDSNTSSLAASQIMMIDHKCKFSYFGCEAKMKLDEINIHEKNCPERTIICPYGKCKKELQLKKFSEHIRANKCAFNKLLETVIDGAFIKIEFYKDRRREFGKTKTLFWKMFKIQAHNLTFYFLLNFVASKKSFIFYVMLPDTEEAASRFTARISLANDYRKHINEVPVLSIEDLPDKDKGDAKFKYLFFSTDAMEPFFSYLNKLQVVFQVEVLKIEKKRRMLT